MSIRALRRYRPLYAFGASGLALTGVGSIASPAQAQAQQNLSSPAAVSDGLGSGEIVVTARNRVERLQDAPLSVMALSATVIEQQRVQTFADIARLDSSLVFDKGSGLQDTRPVIRGLPSSRGRPPVGILIDGVDASTEAFGASSGGSTLLNTRAIEVERIEVVKGPQSALYGRVAFGGAINYVTKKPSETFGGEVGGEVGAYGTYEGRAALTGPLGDGIAARVHGYYSTSDGFYRNELSGKRIGGYESYGGGASLLFDRGGGTALLSVNYSNDTIEPAAQEYAGSRAVANVTIPLASGVAGAQVGTVGATTALPATIQAVPFGIVQRSNIGVRLSLDPRTGQDYPGAHVDTLRTALTINLDVADAVKLTSISSYTHSRFDEREDLDFFGFAQAAVPGPGGAGQGEPFNRFFELNVFNGDVKQLNQELRIGHLDGSPFRWAVGGLYWYEKYQQENTSAAYVVPAGQSAQKNVPLVQDSLPPTHGQRTTQHLSLYGMAEFDLTPRLTVSLEARYARESYDYVFNPFLSTSAVPQANGGYPIVVLVQPVPRRSRSTDVMPKALIRFKPVDNLMVYVSAAKGVKPAGYSTVAVTDSSLAQYDAERLYNYEAGLKGSLLDRKLMFSAAGFYMKYLGKQISVLQPNPLTPSGFANFIRNAGGARVYGLEANVTVRPIEPVTFNVGYTYLDARYTDYEVNVNNALIGSFVNSCVPNVVIGRGQFCRANLRGNRLERTPKHSITGSARYTVPVGDDRRFFVEGDVRYTGSRAIDEYNKRFIPAFTTANVRAGFEGSQFSLLAYVDNVFGSTTLQGAAGVGDQLAPGNFAIIGQLPDKRRFGLRGSRKF
jgi:outer membrane receptor protein involved in Fe transport